MTVLRCGVVWLLVSFSYKLIVYDYNAEMSFIHWQAFLLVNPLMPYQRRDLLLGCQNYLADSTFNTSITTLLHKYYVECRRITVLVQSYWLGTCWFGIGLNCFFERLILQAPPISTTSSKAPQKNPISKSAKAPKNAFTWNEVKRNTSVMEWLLVAGWQVL